MNSFLITGGNYRERLERAKKLIEKRLDKPSTPGLRNSPRIYAGEKENLGAEPDLLIIKADPSIGISQIRDLQKFLARKPYQAKIKAVIISKAEKMTVPGQNAFLKTLEEPPKNSLIILGAQNQDQLLPTIISRCQLIKLPPKPEIEINKSLIAHHLPAQAGSLLITQLLQAKVGHRLQLIEPYTKSREEAIKFCQEMIVVLRETMMLKTPRGCYTLKNTNMNNSSEVKKFRLITSFQKTLHLLQANINVKLALENLVLKLPNNR